MPLTPIGNDHTASQTLAARFIGSALAAPEETAVVDASHATVSYGTLLMAAAELALALREHAPGPNPLIGVAATRDVSCIVGMLAIMMRGGCFVPIDPTLPATRLDRLVSQASLTVIVADARASASFSGRVPVIAACPAPGRAVRADTIASRLSWDVGGQIDPGALAYALFTSGSTGEPRLVGIEHRSVCALLDGFDSVAQPRSRVVSTTVCPFSFDASIWEVFSALTSGGTVHVLPAKIASDPTSLAAELADRGITSAYLPPVGLDFLIDELREVRPAIRLERVMVGAEPIRQGTLQELKDMLPDLTIVNAYGPTEATVCSTFHVFTRATEPNRRTPIGTPVPGWRVMVVGEGLVELPVGAVGEIIVGGAGLARGYIGAPDLTAERFVTGPDGRRWYRTGDLGRWLPNGDLEYVGRRDDQVKIRGFRVELGEVEAALSACPGVRAAVAMALPGPAGLRLIGFAEGDGDGTALRRRLAETVPDYMVPARVIVMPAFPLTANAKVDRRALAAAAARPAANPAPAADPAATPAHRQLSRLWCDILGIDHVGLHDNFFDLGGDSAAAIALVRNIVAAFGADARPTELLRCRTVAEMADRLDTTGAASADSARRTAAKPAAVGRRSLLSAGQEGLWSFQRLNPLSQALVVPVALRVSGAGTVESLRTALVTVLENHQAFALEFGTNDDGPWQQVSSGGWNIDVREELLQESDLDSYLTRTYHHMARDISRLEGRSWRAEISTISSRDQLILLVCHHVIIDGYSIPILVRDISAAIAGHYEPVHHVGPVEFAAEQRDTLNGSRSSRDIAYWSDALGTAPALEMPLDHGRRAAAARRGRTYMQVLPDGVWQRVEELAKRHHVTPFTTVLAAASWLARTYSGQDEFVISTPVAVDRLAPAYAESVGYFVNMLPLRLRPDPGRGFDEVIAVTARQLDEAVDHGSLPFEQIISAYGPARMEAAQGFTRLVVAQHVSLGQPGRTGSVRISEQFVETETAKYELAIFVEQLPDGLRLRWEYDVDLMSADTVARWGETLERLIDEVAEHEAKPIGSICLLGGRDREIIRAANDTETPYPAGSSLTELFDEQVRKHPEAIALDCGHEAMTYAELSARVRRLSAALAERTVHPEEPIIVSTGRTPDFVIALLAVVQAGGSYVPVDARIPAERLRVICRQVDARLAIATQAGAAALPPDIEVIDPARSPSAEPRTPGNPRQATSRAYVMFTSGSTGIPKGVEITDRSIARLVRMQNFAEFGPDDACILASNLAFDAATLEIWAPLLNGGRVFIPDEGTVYDPQELAAAIERQGITAGFFNVSVFRSMIEANPNALRAMHTILVGGEAVPAALVRQAADVLDFRVLVNGYGPTENTTFSCCHRLSAPPEPGRPFPIGRPIANSTVMVVGEGLVELPVGAVGEIIVGGAGLARGYIGAPDLTAERFVTGPDGRRWYRTGDLGRWLPNGDLEYVGRRDDQVKIRGFRVELGEVEAALSACPGVRAAVAMALPGPAGLRLIGFAEGDGDGTALRRRLAETVPDYMVPARVIVMPAFPLTANAKVDRRALAAAAARPAANPAPAADPAATPAHRQLSRLWCDILGIDHVGLHDNFFDLGGDSKSLVLLTERARRAFKNDIRVVDVMAHPTVAELARFLGADKPDTGIAARAADRARARRERSR